MERRSPSLDRLSEVFVGGLWSYLSSATRARPASANTGCGDRKAQSRRGGHLHVAGALERAVELKRRADGRARVLRCLAFNRELIGGRVLGLVEAPEAVTILFHKFHK